MTRLSRQMGHARIDVGYNGGYDGTSSSHMPMVHIRDQKTAGTHGGNSVAGSQTRTLNTVVINHGDLVSLSSNLFVLERGVYYAYGKVPAYSIGNSHKASLYNSTAGTHQVIGSSAWTLALCMDCSIIDGYFQVTAADSYSIQHYTAAAVTNGLGFATSVTTEYYTELMLWRVF